MSLFTKNENEGTEGLIFSEKKRVLKFPGFDRDPGPNPGLGKVRSDGRRRAIYKVYFPDSRMRERPKTIRRKKRHS